IGILPVQHLALFGDSYLPGKIASRLRQDRRMRRPPPATDCTSSAVEQPELDVVFAGSFMQRAVRLIQLPNTREHSTVFVRIGVAKHHFLPARPAIEQAPVIWIAPNFFHDRR